MEIAEIKEKLPLKDVLAHYGLKPDKHGRLSCPFHKDRTPSMQVYYQTGTVYCFSTNCPTHGRAMDVVDLIMHKEGITKHEAITQAKAMVKGSSETSRKTSSSKPSTAPSPSENEKPSGNGWDRRSVLERVFRAFKNGLPRSKQGKAYLEGRSLDLERLEVGYNSGQFHHGVRRDEAWIEGLLEAGLLLDKGGKARTGEKAYRVFARGCICFPLKDPEGDIVGLYFRSTTDDKEQKHFYLKDRQGLYPNYPERTTKRLILTESVIDAASLLQQAVIAEQYAVLALYGTNGLTGEHKEAIRNLPSLEELIFFLNGDDAGKKATKEHAETIRELRPELALSAVDVPEGEDVNSLLQAHEPQVLLHLTQGRSSLLSNEPSDERKRENGTPSTEKGPSSFLADRRAASDERKKEASDGTQEAPGSSEIPDGPSEALDTRNPRKLQYRGEAARYAVLGGLGRELDRLKVTLRTETWKGQKLRTRLDLYEESQVERYIKKASGKLDLDRSALEADLFALTDLLERYREDELLKDEKEREEEGPPPLTAKEREELEAFAKKKGLTERIEELLGKAGIVGEERTRSFLFLIALSHKLAEPLHALIQGSSGSGKTRLLQQIAACMPEEKLTRLTRVSEKAFYNYPEDHFRNRLLCLEDMDGLGEEATFAFRELQSNGELTSSVSYKDENGRIGQAEKRVKGPVASLACTTNGEIYEDNMSRCFLVAVDEGPEQTRRITEYQDRRAAGEVDKEQEERTKAFLQKFVRLLVPYEVRNPYAGRVRLPEEAHKVRRLNELFQGFIKVVTVLHQYQREQDEKGRLIATKADIRTATELMLSSILLKVDELDGSLREFFERLKAYVEEKAREHDAEPSDVDFTRFEVREATGVAKTQQHHTIRRLVELEYLFQSGHANRGYRYRIAHWDDHTALKERIKKGLEEQLKTLEGEHQRTPGRTPEPVSNGKKG